MGDAKLEMAWPRTVVSKRGLEEKNKVAKRGPDEETIVAKRSPKEKNSGEKEPRR